MLSMMMNLLSLVPRSYQSRAQQQLQSLPIRRLKSGRARLVADSNNWNKGNIGPSGHVHIHRKRDSTHWVLTSLLVSLSAYLHHPKG